MSAWWGSEREKIVEIVREHGLLRSDEPVRLASGEYSRDFIDGKAALAHGPDLKLACRVMVDALDGIEFDAVGGLTMGADLFAHAIPTLDGVDCDWFVVRKEPKGRGTNKLIEGAAIRPGSRVVLVDDVVTTGGSIQKAYGALVEAGAVVVAALTLVDRGEVAAAFFAERGIPYTPIVTCRDLGLAPVAIAAEAGQA
jgi:orotate phosphoribosyltransferase